MGTGRGGDRTTRLLLLAAVLLLASGVTAGGVTAWGWWSRVREVHAAQDRLAAEWAGGTRHAGTDATAAAEAAGRRLPASMRLPGAAETADPGSPPAGGAPIALLHVPTLHLKLFVVEGSDAAALMLGPGRIPGTAALGETGNTGIAGHRYPGVFWNLDELGVSAPVVLETRDTWLVYRVVDASVVQPERNDVLAPPPLGAGPLLTLVTCDPKLSTARRLIRQATLVRHDPIDGPRPAELGLTSSRLAEIEEHGQELEGDDTGVIAAVNACITDGSAPTAAARPDPPADPAAAVTPAGGAEACIEDNEISKMIGENTIEVCNIVAGLLNKEDVSRLKLYQTFLPGESAPTGAVNWLLALGRPLDLKVDVSGYGAGKVSIASPADRCGCDLCTGFPVVAAA